MKVYFKEIIGLILYMLRKKYLLDIQMMSGRMFQINLEFKRKT